MFSPFWFLVEEITGIVKQIWKLITGEKVHNEFLRYTFVAFLGWFWHFGIMYVMIDLWNPSFEVVIPVFFLPGGVFLINTWKVAMGIGSVIGLVHNFIMNKRLGGLRKIGDQHSSSQQE